MIATTTEKVVAMIIIRDQRRHQHKNWQILAKSIKMQILLKPYRYLKSDRALGFELELKRHVVEHNIIFVLLVLLVRLLGHGCRGDRLFRTTRD